MKEPTNDLDFTVDFSGNTEGKVLKLEDFLEDTPSSEKKETDLDLSKVDITEEQEVEKTEEEPVKIPKEEEIDESSEETKEVEKSLQNRVSYKSVLDKLIKSKLIDPIESFEMEDGSEVSYDEKDIDEDELLSIIDSKIKEVEEKSSMNKVSTDGISDFTKKLIEIEKNGGDVKKALETYNNVKAPLDNLDLSDESDQKTAIYMRNRARGLNDSEITRLIKSYEADGIIEDKAYEAKEELDEAHKKYLDSINESAIEAKNKREKALLEYKGSLSEKLSAYGIKDSMKRRILDSATKQNQEGTFDLDDLYFKLRQDPEKASELAMFMMYKEDYLRGIHDKIASEEAVNTMKKFRFVKKGSSNISLRDKRDEEDDSKYLMDLENLK